MNLTSIQTAGEALTAAGISWALGGSSVLIAHGLWTDEPSDWDVTTDAEPEQVILALAELGVRRHPQSGDGLYATGARLVVEPNIDLLCRFAVRTEVGIVHLPTIVSTSWQGMPVGSPEVWAVAYRLMGRPVKPDLLSGWLLGHGADPVAKAQLLAQELPLTIREEIESWPIRNL